MPTTALRRLLSKKFQPNANALHEESRSDGAGCAKCDQFAEPIRESRSPLYESIA